MHKISKSIRALSARLPGNIGQITSVRHSTTSYFVLLPEDPVDTAENNALLRSDNGELPNFPEITGEKCYTGVGRLALDFETGVWDLEEKIREDPTNVTFNSIIETLDELDARLNIGWSAAKILYTTRQDIMSQKSYLSLHERARKARVNQFQSLPIYNACKTINERPEDLDECQRRVVRKYLLESRLNGIELAPTKAQNFQNTIKHLNHRKTQFKQKIAVSSMRFAYNISDPDVVKDFPSDLLQRMAVNSDSSGGPWQVTLRPDVYHGFLSHCHKRQLRWNTWQAYNMRGSRILDPELDNSVNLEEIRKFRLDQARHLGYADFGSMSMETKMAGTVDNVMAMITSLMNQAVPRQTEEMESLAEFAHTQGFDGDTLQAYDVPYYSRLQREHLYKGDEDLSAYFPFEHVLGQLLGLCSQLFGIHFEELDPSSDLKAWHPSVRFFNVIDEDGSRIGSFYLDPYKRPGSKLNVSGGSGWFISQRSRSSLSNEPVAALVFNFTQPGTQDCLLSISDVTTLFGKFGEALQHILTTVPYGEASGLTNIEWDAMAVCHHFMANWVFVPSVLESLSRHHETGVSLSPDQISDVIQSANHMAGHNLCKHLYLANLDMLLHTTTDFWRPIVTSLWQRFMPYQLDRNDQHALSFTASAADVWAAAYYGHTWARVMAADCTQAFVGQEEEEWGDQGKRFRSTFLALGGGCHPAEVFRRFRGRDPSTDALTELYGIVSPITATSKAK